MSKTKLQTGYGGWEKNKELLFCFSMSSWMGGSATHYVRNTERRGCVGKVIVYLGSYGFCGVSVTSKMEGTLDIEKWVRRGLARNADLEVMGTWVVFEVMG